MANKKESNGNGTSIVSMFEQVAETGFGEVQPKTSVLRVYLLFRRCLHKGRKTALSISQMQRKEIYFSQVRIPW